MIDTNKVLEQIYKLILAYTKDKKLDSNRAKYVLKTAVEKVLEFNNLNIEAAETIVSAIEKSKVLEKIKTLDFNRLSDNKDYVDPLYGKSINVKQVLAIVHGVIDSQIKSLDAVLFEAQDEAVKSEINEIKLSPITRFSPGAYRLLSKSTVLFESEDSQEVKEESKPNPYKKLLEIADIITKDDASSKIFDIISEFKRDENNKELFVFEILDKRIGKIVEAIVLKVLQEKGDYSITIEGKKSGTKYIEDDGTLALDLMSVKNKDGFNLYAFYKKILSSEDDLTLDIVNTMISEANENRNFNDFIQSDEYLNEIYKNCDKNLIDELNKIQTSFLDEFDNRITFNAFKYKFKNYLDKVEERTLLNNTEVDLPPSDTYINKISISKNCFIPSSVTSSFDLYFDLEITYNNNTVITAKNGLCVDIKHTYKDVYRGVPTKANVNDLTNNLVTSTMLIKNNNFITNTFFTKTNLEVKRDKIAHKYLNFTDMLFTGNIDSIVSDDLISNISLSDRVDIDYRIHYIDRNFCNEVEALEFANNIKEKVLFFNKQRQNVNDIINKIKEEFQSIPYFLSNKFDSHNVLAIITLNDPSVTISSSLRLLMEHNTYINFNKKNDISYCLDALNRIKEFVIENYKQNIDLVKKVRSNFISLSELNIFKEKKFTNAHPTYIVNNHSNESIKEELKDYIDIKKYIYKVNYIKKGDNIDVLKANKLYKKIIKSVLSLLQKNILNDQIIKEVKKQYGRHKCFDSKNFNGKSIEGILNSKSKDLNRSLRNAVTKTNYIKKGTDVDIIEAYDLFIEIIAKVKALYGQNKSRAEIVEDICNTYKENTMFLCDKFNKVVVKNITKKLVKNEV